MAEDRKTLLAQADRALQRGDMGEAATVYRKLLASAPSDLALLQRLGDALARANREAEARDVFRQIADVYWSSGHKSRAMAALRRAARLGSPDVSMLTLLGQRLLEQGLVADAREPLLEAARLAESAGDSATATQVYGQLAEVMPRDLTSREGLVRLADRYAGAIDRARRRIELALARLRGGDPATAFRLLAEALEVDAYHVAVFEELATILPALESEGVTQVPDAPGNLTDEGAAAWIVLRHAAHVRLGTPQHSSALRGALQRGLHPWPQLWAGRVLLQTGDLEGAAAALLPLEQHAPGDEALARELAQTLSSLVEQNPGAQDVVDVMMRISILGESAASGGVAPDEFANRRAIPLAPPDELPEPEPPAPAPTPVRERFEDQPSAPDRLSIDAQAKLLEAEAFAGQGLLEQARAALDSISPADSGHPAVVALKSRVAPAPSRVAAPSPRAAPPSRHEAKPPADDDDMFVILDEHEDTIVDPVTAPEPVSAKVQTPAATAPHAVISGPRMTPDGVDLGQLENLITRSVDPGDAEMGYQMALGLVEMGLGDQAIPLLEQALGDPSRRVDAAVLLARVRIPRGEIERAYQEALAVHHASHDLVPSMQAELFALLADLALRSARAADAKVFVAELIRLHPRHPALPTLRRRITVS